MCEIAPKARAGDKKIIYKRTNLQKNHKNYIFICVCQKKTLSLCANLNIMLKLSVIIPVYNVAPYVRKCVESVLAQDLNPMDYEVILVDDGSTDGSGAICDELAQSTIAGTAHYPQSTIYVIHQENQGLSAARNAGIAVAKGKYIQFVDSDDYLEPNVLGGLVEQMEREQLDVLRFDYQNVKINPQSTIHNPQSEAYEVFEPNKTPRQVDKCTEITDGETYLNTRMGYACYAVQFMIRRSSLTPSSVSASPEGEGSDTGCLFTPGIYFEDTDWTPRMLLRAQRVNATTTIVYNYLMREGSITKAIATEKQRKVLEDKIRLIGALQQMSEGAKDKRWFKGMIDATVLSALGIVALQFWTERKKYWEQLRKLKVYPLNLQKQSRSVKVKYSLINLSPVIYCELIRWKNK